MHTLDPFGGAHLDTGALFDQGGTPPDPNNPPAEGGGEGGPDGGILING